MFILVDDLGWADLGCYGSRYYETRRIDQLAHRGMRFTNAYAACPACSPTGASILTGKYRARLGLTDWIPGRTPANAKLLIPDWRKYLPREEVTLAEVLKSAGYATAAVGKWHLGDEPYFPEQQGFDLNVAGSEAGAPKSYFHPYGRPQLSGGKPGEYLTDRLTAEAVDFIAAHRQAPLFLYLAHYAVHTPIQAKKELRASHFLQVAVFQEGGGAYSGLGRRIHERHWSEMRWERKSLASARNMGPRQQFGLPPEHAAVAA